MATRKRALQYEKTYSVAKDASGASELPEIEAVLARLVARAYIADHPELMGTDDRAAHENGAKS